jgi:hypothetical protein
MFRRRNAPAPAPWEPLVRPVPTMPNPGVPEKRGARPPDATTSALVARLNRVERERDALLEATRADTAEIAQLRVQLGDLLLQLKAVGP